MKGPDLVTKKCLILLCEDLGYSLKQLSSIIKDNDYEGLGNHATGVMGETSIFILAQVCSSVPFFFFFFILLLSRSNLCFLFLLEVVMMKGLMDRCTSHEMVMGHLREKAEVGR